MHRAAAAELALFGAAVLASYAAAVLASYAAAALALFAAAVLASFAAAVLASFAAAVMSGQYACDDGDGGSVCGISTVGQHELWDQERINVELEGESVDLSVAASQEHKAETRSSI